ncbi:MAG: hypothetical protein QGH60_23905 [Phycisphaerae bacterium]|nr:hypothetical protein [Phycisphaerae bacterium]
MTESGASLETLDTTGVKSRKHQRRHHGVSGELTVSNASRSGITTFPRFKTVSARPRALREYAARRSSSPANRPIASAKASESPCAAESPHSRSA